MRWIIYQLLWDTAGTAHAGLWRGFWATRKLVLAAAISVFFDWREWVEHHPPSMALVALIHFVFVMAAVALVVYLGGRFRRGHRV
jgi:hypothetical protein